VTAGAGCGVVLGVVEGGFSGSGGGGGTTAAFTSAGAIFILVLLKIVFPLLYFGLLINAGLSALISARVNPFALAIALSVSPGCTRTAVFGLLGSAIATFIPH
jgi:hypothetical protein